MYVERVGDAFRWSLTHPGGPYPMLRITARFLRVDHRGIVVGCRTTSGGVCVLAGPPGNEMEPDAWAVVRFDEPSSQAEARDRIESALSPG